MPKQQNLYSPGNKVNTNEYKDNWERIFGKKNQKEKDENVQQGKDVRDQN